jgi:hypothetical protein
MKEKALTEGELTKLAPFLSVLCFGTKILSYILWFAQKLWTICMALLQL